MENDSQMMNNLIKQINNAYSKSSNEFMRISELIQFTDMFVELTEYVNNKFSKHGIYATIRLMELQLLTLTISFFKKYKINSKDYIPNKSELAIHTFRTIFVNSALHNITNYESDIVVLDIYKNAIFAIMKMYKREATS